MEKKQPKSRKFVFTVPNYTEEELNHFHKLAESLELHRYINYGLELGDTNFPHIQAYIEFKEAQRFFFLHKYINIIRNDELLKFHIEIANGTAEDNKDYGGKEGNFFEFGQPMTQGARNDLIEIKNQVKANPKDLHRIIDELANNHQQLRFAQSLQPIYLKHRDPAFPPKVLWIYGRTGIGKTRLVHDSFGDLCSVSDGKWPGTGYQQNECLLFDDFREGDVPFAQLLRITDRYPFDLQCKGGFIRLNSPFIVFTAPESIDRSFPFASSNRENLRQLKRRVFEIDLDMVLDIDALDLRNYTPEA